MKSGLSPRRTGAGSYIIDSDSVAVLFSEGVSGGVIAGLTRNPCGIDQAADHAAWIPDRVRDNSLVAGA
jgi:hypothetical protein